MQNLPKASQGHVSLHCTCVPAPERAASYWLRCFGARGASVRMFCARGSRGGAFVRAPPARGHVGNTKGCRTALRVRLQVRAPQLLASRTELCSKLGHRLSQSLCIALANACRVCGCGSLLHCAECTGFAVALLADGIRIRRCHSVPGTVWPSGLRRWLQAPVCKGVGSNPTAVTCEAAPSALAPRTRNAACNHP